MSGGIKSEHAALLNRLAEMQEAAYYATGRHTLALAERTVLQLERELEARRISVAEATTLLRDLVGAYDAMPDGALGRGLTNGHFLRAKDWLTHNA